MIVQEADLPDMVASFYARVRQDPLIGPLFNAVVTDWPAHVARITDFWSSVMLTTGRYKGNPMLKHQVLASRMDPSMFVRWLEIWDRTTSDFLAPEAAAAMQDKARRIAERLQLAMAQRTGGPSQPYRSTPVFDSATLPTALRRAHRTKAGVWAIIRVLTGQVRYTIEETGEATILAPGRPGRVYPEQLHHVEPIGAMQMRVDFYDHDPFPDAII